MSVESLCCYSNNYIVFFIFLDIMSSENTQSDFMRALNLSALEVLVLSIFYLMLLLFILNYIAEENIKLFTPLHLFQSSYLVKKFQTYNQLIKYSYIFPNSLWCSYNGPRPVTYQCINISNPLW